MGTHSRPIREARNLAAARGHKLGEFLLTRIQTGSPATGTRGCMVAVCEYCGASAAVDRDHPPGVSEIWGEALERDCPGGVLAD
jgi:hypothetical protein